MRTDLRIAALLSCAAAIALLGLGVIRGAAQPADLPRLETRLFGQSTWLAGSAASLRVLVQDHTRSAPVRSARVEVALEPAGDAKAGARPATAPRGRGSATPPPRRATATRATPSRVVLYRGRTNSLGTVDATFPVPDWPSGPYRLTVTAAGLSEKDSLQETVTLRTGEQLLLTTDKPLYQPGQTMHIRALALRQPDQKPMAGVESTLEVEDSKGNKVFKKKAATSEHGIFAADFVLASEVNQGRYTFRALVGQVRQEKTVTVERYVLPKFRVSLTPDRKYYQPGQVMSGRVQGDYFFGKPVARAKVTVTLSKFDAGFSEFARVEGHLGEDGSFKFEQALPGHFVGQPLEQGNAFVKYDVAVTDTADHTEKISGTVPVAAQPMRITVVPESGRVVPNVENQLYILATQPDGSPAKANLTVTYAAGRVADRLATDAAGVAVWRIVPREPSLTLRITAVDDTGGRADANVHVTGEYQPGSLILRADRALYTVGDTMRLTALAPEGSGTVYVDLVRAGQTVLTRAAAMMGGRAELAVSLSPDMAGTLQAHAYRIQPDGQIVRDTRIVFVDPGAALKIDVRPDRQTYLPGAQAKLALQVRADGRAGGRDVFPAALGVSIVDESVFALQEMQPGMEKVYFLLEKEILEPRYEIHGITPDRIVDPTIQRDKMRQRAAAILFASLPRHTTFTLMANSYEEKLARLFEQWARKLQADGPKIAAALKAYRSRTGKDPDWDQAVEIFVHEGLLDEKEARDPFGRYYRMLQGGWIVISAGPDGKEETGDEYGAYLATGPGGQVRVFRGMWSRRRGGFMGVPRAAAAGGMMGGGMGGAVMEERLAMAVPAPAALDGVLPAGAVEKASRDGGGGGGAPEVRVRQYFPETLFWNPAVITDERGRATLTVPMADSITTWRLTAMGSSPGGLLGSTTAPLRVFQDFFVDIDFPVSLTQNDEVAVPIAVYNYLDDSQRVRLVVEREPWFELLEDPEKTLEIGSSDVRGASFRIRVKQIGFHKLTVRAYGTKMNDAVRREVEVVPDGRRVEATVNDRLEGPVRRTVVIPEGAIPNASNILVKVYPGFLSQAVEGMDKILQMPFGCFEQTSSTTYPNVLVMDYMRSTNKITPEIQMKAEQYINLGYQRLVTFEVPGGGFSWFGDAPANKILTAYGLMEFQDMSAVHEVDPAVIQRTREWLLAQQQADGSWKPDQAYLHEESWGRIQHSELLPTAYILWALLHGGEGGKPAADARLTKAADYVVRHRQDASDPYTLGIIANALVAAGRAEANDVLGGLLEQAKEKDGALYWESEAATVTFSHGEAANVEATALIGYALVRSGRFPNQAGKVITYLIRAKDPNGTWHSTQATVLALKTLLESQKGAARGVEASVTVRINGQEAGSFRITPDNADVMQQVDLKRFVRPGRNEVEIGFEGKGASLYQIASYHYMPWQGREEPGGGAPRLMDIQVKYDRTELEKDDTITADVTVSYNGPGAANMVMVDLGIPPGFDVLTEDLNELVGSKLIQRFQLTPRQAILYIEKLEREKPLKFRYRMKAKFPLRAKTAPSTVYQYYNPEVRDVSPPVEVVVR